MGATVIVSVFAPLLGLLGLLVFRPGEGALLTSAYVQWFAAGAALQVTAAALLFRTTQRAWKQGWTLLWLASACYMGGYSNLYLQEEETVARTTAVAAILAEKASDPERRRELEEAWTERFEGAVEVPAPDRAMADALAGDAWVLVGLQYVLSLLFVCAFYTIGALVSRRLLDAYGVLDPDLEDPLAFKAEYGLE